MEPASATPATGMVMFDVFPALRALGQRRLQELCDEWLATDAARALNVKALTVGDESTGFALTPDSTADISQRIDERLYQFTLSILSHLVARGLPPEQHGLIERLKTLITRPPGMMAPPPSPARRAGFMPSMTPEPPAAPEFRSRRPMLTAQSWAERARAAESAQGGPDAPPSPYNAARQ